MLKFRLDYLYDTVDKFILVEATLTHSGKTKELYYNNNKHLFEKYNDKIIHIIVDDLPTLEETNNSWDREIKHREGIDKGLNQLNLKDNDILCSCDLDEIPDKNALDYIRNLPKIENDIYSLRQDMYIYNLNCKYTHKWDYAKIFNFYTYKNIFNKDLYKIRTLHTEQTVYKIIKDGGWHFSYFGDVNFIKNKLLNCAAHREYNENHINEEYIINNIKTNENLLNVKGVYKYIDIKDNN